ncbi:MAG: histidinol-phosphate transaminase [Pseudomonadales bacterium]|jgi:histidinol-phosphate aminotransferase|nr:histidinol-phosphate transaminase [Pseudomonadales bacterium]
MTDPAILSSQREARGDAPNWPRPQPWVDGVQVYLPGESAVPGVAEVVKLSSNESALGASPAALAAARALSDYGRYPDPDCLALKDAIATRYGVRADRIVCEAGSEQLINLLARAYAGPGDEILFPDYAFIAYRIAAQSCGATPVAAPARDFAADVDALLACVTPRTRVLFLANPNNPTGTMLHRAEILRLRAGLPDAVLLVLDGAYSEYVADPAYSAGEDLVTDARPNVVVTHTFSKMYGLAALRIGWALCPAPVHDALERLRGVFVVGATAQAAAVAALADIEHQQTCLAHNGRWLAWLTAELQALGIRVLPASGNFLCLDFADPEACAAADLALRRGGLIPRTLREYGMPGQLRITVGLEAHNRRVVEILAAR